MTEYIVTIKDRRKARQRRRQTMALPGRHGDDLGRRRLQQKNYINIYDFGRLADGSDISYHIDSTELFADTTYNALTSYFASDGRVFVFNQAPSSAQTWNDFVLLESSDDWPDIYRNISTELTNYRMSIGGLGDYTPGRGYEIPSDITALRGTNGFAWDVLTQPCDYFPIWLDHLASIATKTTRLPDYTDTSVSLVLDKSVDVFLTPFLWGSDAVAQDNSSADVSVPFLPQTWYFSLEQGRALPRAATFPGTAWDEIFANRNAQGLNSAGAKAYYVSTMINNGTSTLLTISAELADWTGPTTMTVPPGKISTGTSGFPSGGSFNAAASTLPSGFSDGVLLAAVRKHVGGSYEWYYIWSAVGFGTIRNLVNEMPL